MTEITQADRDAAQRFWDGLADDSNSWGHLSGYEKDNAIRAFSSHRQIELTDAMIEAGAAVERNAQEFKNCKALATAVFNAMMGAR